MSGPERASFTVGTRIFCSKAPEDSACSFSATRNTDGMSIELVCVQHRGYGNDRVPADERTVILRFADAQEVDIRWVATSWVAPS